MFKILHKTLTTGIVTAPYPDAAPLVSEQFRGRPEFDFAKWRDARPAAEVCPTGAIAIHDRDDSRHVTVDYGRCIFCGLCAEACSTDALELTQDYEMALYSREGMVLDQAALERGQEPEKYVK